MANKMYFFFLLLAIGFSSEVWAQEKDKEAHKLMRAALPETSVTEHEITVNGKVLRYTATTGYTTLQKEDGTERAHVFFVAYTKKDVKNPKTRPLTFSFNGGPGSSSVWLHLGVLGPRRVQMTEEGHPLPPPYSIVDNEYTWLEETDLVFIDPVTTGYSRAVEPEKGDEFHGYSGDIQSVGDFIRRYCGEHERWGSPKYLIGESYGTTRASGLSDYLTSQYGMYLNGVILVSAVTDFQTLRFDKGNDLPYALFLPTYTASAYYHGKLEQALLDQPLEKVLDEVEDFVLNEYSVALMKGSLLKGEERQRIIDKLHRYTGISKVFIERANLRLMIFDFTKELLRDNSEIIGRFDSRYKGVDVYANASRPERDPSYQPTILGTFGTSINDYLGRELKFKSPLPYNILTGRVHPWDYGNLSRYVNVAKNLRKAMTHNPDMKVWIANGYYDLATPYFATEYTLHHMELSPQQEARVQMTYYPAGHMMYLHQPSLAQMKEEAKAFYKEK